MQALEPYRHLIGAIQQLDNLLQQSGDLIYEEVSAKQWYVLCQIQQFGDEAPTLNQLAEQTGSSHQNVKQMVVKLERKGYVRVYTDGQDRRKRRIALTERCETLWQKYAGRQEVFLRRGFQGIETAEVERTLKTLKKLEENFRALSQNGSQP